MLADSTSTCCKQTASLSLCMAVVLGMRSLEGFVQTLYSISAATQGCCHSSSKQKNSKFPQRKLYF